MAEFDIPTEDRQALAAHHALFHGAVAALTARKLQHRQWCIAPEPGEDITIPKGQGGIRVKYRHGEEVKPCWVVIGSDSLYIEGGAAGRQETQILAAVRDSLIELVNAFKREGVAALTPYEPYRQKTGLGHDPLNRFFAGCALL